MSEISGLFDALGGHDRQPADGFYEACCDAMRWLRKGCEAETLEQAWDECPEPSWLAWLAESMELVPEPVMNRVSARGERVDDLCALVRTTWGRSGSHLAETVDARYILRHVDRDAVLAEVRSRLAAANKDEDR